MQIVTYVCKLQDFLYNIYDRIRYIYLSIIWWYLKFIMQNKAMVKPRVCAAHCGSDITPIVTQYYKHDNVLSTYSMETWLRHCGISQAVQTQHAVTIVYIVDADMRCSTINLQDDLELKTMTYISDVDLSTLPGRILN
jgi:hypothetical protein